MMRVRVMASAVMLVGGLVAGAAAPARAGQILAASEFDRSLSREVRVSFAGESESVLAGPFTTTAWENGREILSLTSYCVDLGEADRPGKTKATIGRVDDVLEATGVRDDDDDRFVAAAGYLVSTIVPTTSLEHAALQVAIWESIYDFEYGRGTSLGTYRGATAALQSGLFRLRESTGSTIFGLARDYLTQAWSGSGYRSRPALIVDYPPAGGPPYSQDQVLVTAVPEPASIVLVGLGAVGLAGAALRGRRRPHDA